MPTTVPVTFRASPLPQNFVGTPQQFADALVARLAIEAQTQIAFYVTGSVAPSSDVGAWLKNGVTWYVWDVVTGAYIPEIIESESLKYIAQVTEPDPNKYTFWIELDGGGAATAIKTYSALAWHDVYEATFANIYTKAQTDAAITAAIDEGAVAGSAAFKAESNASQDVVFAVPGNTLTTLAFGVEVYDDDSVFADNAFVAPEAGIYVFKAAAYINVTAGTPTDNVLSLNICVNGNPSATQLFPDSSTGARIYNLTQDLKLNAGDTVTVTADIQIGGGSGTWTINGAYWTSFSGFRIK